MSESPLHRTPWIALLGALVGTAGCSTSSVTFETIEPEPYQSVRDKKGRVFQIHLSEAWYPFRARGLNKTPEETRSRDEAISDRRPPTDFWDAQTATEAAAIWGGLCNDCHGGRRSVAEARKIPAPPEDWGDGVGLFFGEERERAEIFRTIFNGGGMHGDEMSDMPAWGRQLSREQIWSLVYYIEHESRGIAGNFPPGLYPERRNIRTPDPN